jgi:hypothetical protein
MTNLRLCLSLLLGALVLAPTWAQPPPPEPPDFAPLRYYDFEQDSAPWVSLNPQAIVGLTAVQENMLAGTSALEVWYLFAPTNTGMDGMLSGSAILPLPDGIPGMASMTFGFKSSEAITAVVGVRERGGGAYMAPFFSPGKVWQRVVLGLDDFYPVDGMVDPDGILEPEQLEGLGILDASNFLATMAAKLPVAGFEPGARKMWLDEVKLLRTKWDPEAVPFPAGQPAPVVIDTCDRKGIRWIVLGGKDWQAAREADDPTGRVAGTWHYRFEYTLPGGTMVAWLKPVHLGQLADTKALHLSARSDQAVKLIVSVQEKGNARYSQQIELAAGADWKRFDLAWNDFALDKDSKDDDGKLDPDQVTMLSLDDISALSGPPQARKTILWLDDVYATK